MALPKKSAPARLKADQSNRSGASTRTRGQTNALKAKKIVSGRKNKFRTGIA